LLPGGLSTHDGQYARSAMSTTPVWVQRLFAGLLSSNSLGELSQEEKRRILVSPPRCQIVFNAANLANVVEVFVFFSV